jgi:predicted naringenin-chalcone synthase
MAWTVGDHGFEMTLGARVPDILQAEVGAWAASTLATHGLAIGDVGAWAIHPGGPRVIESVLASLRLPADAGDASRAVLRAHGNMSSATLLFILERLLRANAPRPWVGLAFGPGLVGEMVVVR